MCDNYFYISEYFAVFDHTDQIDMFINNHEETSPARKSHKHTQLL